MIIDFTHIIDNGITSYTEDTKPKIEEIATIDKDCYEERSINIFTHTGTHIDSARHMLNEGRYIDEYKLEELIGPAVILDFSNIKEGEKSTLTEVSKNNETHKKIEITKDDLIIYKEEISKAEFVLIKTGWEKYWCKEKYLVNYPTLTIEAAKYLASFNLKAVGVDCISIGKHESEIALHKIFLEKGILIIENLSLEKTISGIFKLVVAPLKIRNSDGVPVRIFGFV